MKTFLALLAAVLTALFLSSCTSTDATSVDGHTDHQHPEEPVISGAPAGFNADDLAFVTNMIPHHQQAVELSDLVPERTGNAGLVALAQKISAGQQPEINAMRVLKVQWSENPQDDSANDGHEGHAGMDGMEGMVDDATMTRLQSATGAEFDKLWLQSMIGHHEGAIAMAKAEIADGVNVDAKRMAQAMIDTQQAEISQMKQMSGGDQNGR